MTPDKEMERMGSERLTSEAGTLTQRTRLWLLHRYIFARLWLGLLWDVFYGWWR